MVPLPSVARKLAELLGGAQGAVTTYTGTVQQVGSTYMVLMDGATQATECTPEVKAITGDRVTVEIRNHMATVRGNITHPTTDDAQADAALTQAGIAASAAAEAQTSAGNAATAAGNAQTAAENAATAAGNAQTAAGNAQTAAENAQRSADDAQESADDALAQAGHATGYANDALVQLSVVQSVLDTLSWVSEHGTYSLTGDTKVDATKAYFALVGGVYELVQDPVEDDLAGYYELSIDEAVTNYVSTHLALTDEGLWVIPTIAYEYRLTEDTELVDGKVYYALVDGEYEPIASPQAASIASYYEHAQVNGYRLLVSNESVTIVDPDGRNVTTFGESIDFASEREQRIGGTDAYVAWVDTDNDGIADSLRIVADAIDLSDGVGLMRAGDTDELERQVAENRGELDTLGGYVRVNPSAASLELGRDGAMAKAHLDNDSLDFMYGDSVAASVGVDDDGNGTLYIDRAKVRDGGYIQLGSWQWVPRANGNVALKWVGGDV